MDKDNKEKNNKVSFDKEVLVGFVTDSPGIKAEAEFDLMDTPSDKQTRKDNTVLRNAILGAIGKPPLAEDGEPGLKRDSNTKKINGKPIKVDPEKDKELVSERWGRESVAKSNNQGLKMPSRQKADQMPSAPVRRRPSLDVEENVDLDKKPPAKQKSNKSYSEGMDNRGFANKIKDEKSNKGRGGEIG